MARSFALDLKAFAQLAGKASAQVAALTGIDMHSRVVARTPVDTGRARANWLVDVGTPRNGTYARDDKGPLGSPPGTGEASRLHDFKGGTIYISNNLPYIGALEDGHSGQAPAGMVAVTVAEFEQVVRAAVEKARV